VIDGDDTDDKLPSMSEDSYILEESHIMKVRIAYTAVNRLLVFIVSHFSQF